MRSPMMRVLGLLSIAMTLAIDAGADTRLVRDSEPLSVEQERAELRVPEGFEIRAFASEPMINKPINVAVDQRGRVWVSSTVEYPYAAAKSRWSDPQGTRVRDSRDAIKILEDSDGDGRADKVTDFADGLNIPTGVLPWHRPEHHDGCIAWSIPNIWYFADTTGDGKCDHRKVLFGPLGYEKDTHGMCSSFRLGPDGWVYATHGFNNTSHFEAADGSTLDLHSGNVFRFRPDGSRIELWSGGQVNPFGLCFDRRGNLYSADCHSSPVYQLLHGAVYPSFGKPHDGLGFGPAMIEHSHGSTGIAGIAWVDREVWGRDWEDRVLIGNPVTSRINLDRIEFRASTPVAIEQPDFVVSEDPWFRPVDLCLADDGALYIADFYNRIIGHYEVPLDHEGRDRERGRIWQVVKKSGVQAPRPALEIEAIADPIAALADESPFRRRAAAATLQQEPRIEALAALRAALDETAEQDTHLRHTLRLAIREHLRLPGAFESLSDAGEAADVELASIALAVGTEAAAEYLLKSEAVDDDDFRRRRLTHVARYGSEGTVTMLISREWVAAGTDALAGAESIRLIHQGLEERGQLRPNPELLHWGTHLAERLLLLRKTAGPAEWTAVAHPDSPSGASPWVLQNRRCADGRELAVLSSLPRGEKGAEQGTGILRSRNFVVPESLSLWICGHRGLPGQPAHDRNFVRLVDADSGAELARAFPPRNDVCQEVAWDLAAHSGGQAHLEIVDGDSGKSYAWLGVTRVGIPGLEPSAFRKASANETALRQLAVLLKIHAPVHLRDQLKLFLPPSPPAPPREVSAEERERLDSLIAERVKKFDAAKAEPERGAELFRAQCAICHQVDGEGGLIGPQLDGIGSRGAARLSEDILDPNRNVDAHFYVTTVTLNDGTTIAGFALGERGEILQVVDTSGAEHRIANSTIAKRETSPLSLMPAAFGQTLSETQFSDLLAWLLERR